MIFRQHWGLLKKDKLVLGGERVKPTVADKDSSTYGHKAFDIVLKAEISNDDELAMPQQPPGRPARVRAKRLGHVAKKKA
jgi:hypothetical protein